MNTIITGAHGVVGTAVTEHSSARYTLLDKHSPDATLSDGTDHPHIDRKTLTTDVSNLDALVDAFDGHDQVVHLAGSPSPDAPYAAVERNNVRGTHNALEAARQTDVEAFVFASSNHVVGLYEDEHAPRLYNPDYDLTVDHESPIRPDSHYGSSKAAGEAWGRQYAELYGIQFYALRIGSVRPPRWDHPFGDAERGVEEGSWDRKSQEYQRQAARLRCTWQSRRDFAHMVEQCLADDSVEFDIFYGVSDNPDTWFDVTHARERIDYEPRDSAGDAVWDDYELTE
jgi:nucleoside-diphosphate-sugar epimerase